MYFLTSARSSTSRQLAVASLAAFSLAFVCSSHAQSTTAKPASPPTPSSPGFAIESEMMTYTAMDAEAQALACGITRNVGVTDDKCTPRGMSGPVGGIVVVSSPSSALAEFQLWRADISNMSMLTSRATPFCAKTAERGASSSSSSSLGSTILSMLPGGQALSFAQSLLSSTSESAPLEGNVIDQTLVNDVAGHLRALGVSVVIPDTYMPGSLMALDERHSPYMTKLLALMKVRDCLVPAAKEKLPDEHPEAGGEGNKQAGDQDAAEKQGIADAIDAFLRGLNQAQIAPPPPATTSTQTSTVPAPAQAYDLPSQRGSEGRRPGPATRHCLRRATIGRRWGLVSPFPQGARIRWNGAQNRQRDPGIEDNLCRRRGRHLRAVPSRGKRRLFGSFL